ncbi:MAG: DUF192 domain-containing protein [Acidimicrobiales bacterium]|nr:DUF192 domain-containing protein [Acidimicrobiales bacterium]
MSALRWTMPTLLAVVSLVSACTGSDSADSARATTAETATSVVASTAAPQTTVVESAPAAIVDPLVPFDGFGWGTVRVAAQAELLDVLVASTSDQRRQGLMFVDDMQGWDGMWFVFDQPTDGGFWMKNTVMPLSIAWVSPDGVVVATADMEPCPAEPCPIYRADALYSAALEVPKGNLAGLGVEVGTQLDLVSRSG